MVLPFRLPSLSRRLIAGGAGAVFASAFMPRVLSAAGARDPRLVVIVLRGALDGLSAVPPVGDPAYRELRQQLAFDLDGPNKAVRLDDLFGLHGSMGTVARLYVAREAAIVHASATPYRERSHFDGQDVLESGYAAPGRIDSGWLNRLIAALPRGERVATQAPPRGLAVGPTAPLVIRGPAPVLGWAPATLKAADPDLPRRLTDLYAHTDPMFARLLEEGIETGKIAAGLDMKARGSAGDPVGMEQMAAGAARLLAQPAGPRVVALAFEGWDTHAQELGRLARLLSGLDGAIAAFHKELGPAWKDTAVVVVTEFGRTARVNGTQGTDHGTGTVMLLAGGAIRGGRVIGDWPGLAQNRLRDGRDLAPTTDTRAVIKGIAADLFGVSAAALDRDVFPESAAARPMKDVVA
ncbi:DUF1501 domain-containing protein [Reyranella sp.]|uniref:DUF1501 domain-containing protein n=1 Tax=Reyranella sp. TaxID=1929291 RepID=UPI003BAAB65D